MVIDQLDQIKNQTESVLRNRVSGSVARLRAQTSLVGQASRLTGRMSRQLDEAGKKLQTSGKKPGYRPETDTVAEKPQAVKPAPDGYLRRSAVQPIRVPADYRRRMVRKVVGGMLLGIVLVAAVWILMKSNLLAY